MSFSANKTTLALIHGIATATIIKQPLPIRAIVLANTALTIYVNNKPKVIEKELIVSKACSFIIGATLAYYTKKHKQHIRSVAYMSSSFILDKMK